VRFEWRGFEWRESWRWLDATKRSNEVEKEGRWIAFVEEDRERLSEAAAERWLGFEDAQKWRMRKTG